jgi:Asp-tRNA(Asn)/Glu-tRNA(Gln) amidotransferase A subunit family amidase
VLAWDALIGPDEGGAHADPPRPSKVGILGGWFLERIQPEVVEGVRAAASTLEGLGVAIEPVDGDGLEDALQTWSDFAWSQFAEVHGNLLDHPDLVDPLTLSYLRQGAALTGEERMAARLRAEEIGQWFAERLRRVDVLLSPATPFPAPPASAEEVEVREGVTLGVHRGAPSAMTRPVSLSGLPALAIPSGLSGDGLPLGIQLIAGRRRERLLLETAAMLGEADSRFRPMRAPYPPPGLDPSGFE